MNDDTIEIIKQMIEDGKSDNEISCRLLVLYGCDIMEAKTYIRMVKRIIDEEVNPKPEVSQVKIKAFWGMIGSLALLILSIILFMASKEAGHIGNIFSVHYINPLHYVKLAINLIVMVASGIKLLVCLIVFLK